MGFDEVPGFLESPKWEFREFGDGWGHLRHDLLLFLLLGLVCFFCFFCFFGNRRRSGGRRSDGFGVEDLVFDGRGLLFLCA
jgi:hypothetical protein